MIDFYTITTELHEMTERIFEAKTLKEIPYILEEYDLYNCYIVVNDTFLNESIKLAECIEGEYLAINHICFISPDPKPINIQWNLIGRISYRILIKFLIKRIPLSLHPSVQEGSFWIFMCCL